MSAPSPSNVYGAGLPILTPSFSGVKNNDSVGATCSTTATASSKIGAYTVSCAVTPDSNYTITTIDGTLTVTPAPLTVSASATKVYGDDVPALVASYSGLVNGETAPTTPASCSTSADARSPAGQYDVTCTGAADDNYTISYATGQLTVTPAPLTITAPSPSKTYGADLPSSLDPTYTGLVNGDPATATPPTCSTTATASSVVGDYAVACSAAVDPNYTIAYVSGTMHVVRAALTVLAPSATETYGFTTPPVLIAEYVGLVNGDSLPATSAQCKTAAGPGSDATAYAVSCDGASDANYTITNVAGTFTINPAALTITANDQSITYGDATPPLDVSYSAFAYSDGPSSLSGALSCATDAGTLHAGSHVITCSGQSSTNYTISYVTGTVTVATKALVGQVGSDTIVYGDAVLSLPISYNGLVNGDTAVSLGLPTVGCTSLGVKPVAGNHAVTCDAQSTSDYDVTYVAGNLTVTKAAVLVTAHDASMTYGDLVPEFTSEMSGNADSTVTGSLSCTTDSAAPHAGTHPIDCTGLDSPNYTITYVAGKLVVGKANLNGQVDSSSIIYGQSSPALALNYTGFENGDSAASLGLPSSCAGPSGKLAVGSYDVTCGTATLADYVVNVAGGTLKVGPAPLTVQTDSHAIVYGQPVPAFGVTYDGLTGGDGPSALAGALTCDAPSGVVGAGDHLVLCDGVTSDNYAITFNAGTLTVTKADLMVAAKNASMVYGAGLPTLTADVVGAAVLGGDASITGVLSCTTASGVLHVGEYPITCSGLSSPNYAITYNGAMLSVIPADLIGTTNSANTSYGTAVPSFGVDYSGWKNGDSDSSLTGALSCNPPASPVHVGSYLVHCGGQSDPDYNLIYLDGTLNVTPAALAGQTGSQTLTYGVAPTIGLSYTGFQNTDDVSNLSGSVVCNTPPGVVHVGSYPVSCGGQTSADYTISYSPGSLTVTQANAMGSVAGGSITYGQSVPVFGVTYSGLVNGDSAFSLGLPTSCPQPATVHVGSYSIACSATSKADYLVGYTPGTFNVAQAHVTVNAPNATRYAGTANPTLTPSYIGFVNSETAAVLTTPASCSSVATASSPAGAYPIVCSGAAAHDYTFSYVAGILTVKVNYQIKVFTQPINDGAGATQSVFKGGSTIPVKFQITDTAGVLLADSQAQAIADACNANINYGFVGGAVGTVDETALIATPTTGSCFRYDSTARQFIYNLSTKPMATGTWTLGVTVVMPDTSVISHAVNVGLR